LVWQRHYGCTPGTAPDAAMRSSENGREAKP
jgi:hypothetical protein